MVKVQVSAQKDGKAECSASKQAKGCCPASKEVKQVSIQSPKAASQKN